MSLRIICLEAHFYETEWAKAAAPTIARMAPYIIDLGSQTKDDPEAWGDHRPHLEEGMRAVELASASIESRIEKMGMPMASIPKSYRLPSPSKECRSGRLSTCPAR